jgi:hypothetical protein
MSIAGVYHVVRGGSMEKGSGHGQSHVNEFISKLEKRNPKFETNPKSE